MSKSALIKTLQLNQKEKGDSKNKGVKEKEGRRKGEKNGRGRGSCDKKAHFHETDLVSLSD